MGAYFIVIYIICGAYMLLNFKHDLQMLQQNSYRISRYWKWLKGGDTASAWRIVDVAMIFILFSTLVDVRVAAFAAALVALCKIWMIIRRKSKKPLVFTRRVWRLYSVASAIAIAAYIAVTVTCGTRSDIMGYYSAYSVSLGMLFLLTAFSWSIVIAAVTLLMPVEKSINHKYWRQASDILKSMPDLTVVGVTGSYGKTSTKHYLDRILAEKYDVLMTPGSYNTTMGVIRTVREMMKPFNRIFICEMGAKQRGDVKEICDLVHPRIGIVTAVGPMHLESFKSIENVQKTKFELIDSLPSDGLAVINNDFEYCANRAVDNVKAIRYGVSNTEGCQYTAGNIVYSPLGTSFEVNCPDGTSFRLETKLLGECNISNILGASVVALHLGVTPQQIQYAVASLEQVEHRLNINRTAGGVNIIDDAFNSNPAGSRMAVDVLAQFKGGKRIIVTPGMIELGSEQYELNRKLGEYVGKNVDVAIIVGEYNHDSLTEGVKSTDFDTKNLYEVASFNEAQQILSRILAPGDTVLYENDLPDTFK